MLDSYTKIVKAGHSPELARVCHTVKGSLEAFRSGGNKLTEEPDWLNMYTIFTPASLEEVKSSVFKEFAKTDCEPGQAFRARVEVFSKYDKEGTAYYILDYWALDI